MDLSGGGGGRRTRGRCTQDSSYQNPNRLWLVFQAFKNTSARLGRAWLQQEIGLDTRQLSTGCCTGGVVRRIFLPVESRFTPGLRRKQISPPATAIYPPKVKAINLKIEAQNATAHLSMQTLPGRRRSVLPDRTFLSATTAIIGAAEVVGRW